MNSFTGLHKSLLPYWLSSGEGDLVQQSLNRVYNAFAERCRESRLASFPTYAPSDALPLLGHDRQIVRGINETDASYAERLLRYLDDHRVQGNAYALMDQLAAYCQADVRIRTVDRKGTWHTRERDGTRTINRRLMNWDWDDWIIDRWARFWVIIYPTAAGLPWSASTGSGAWPVGGTVGTTATPDQVASVRQIVHDWQPKGTRCEWIIIAFDDDSFDPLSPEPDGDWKYYGYDDSGSWQPARLATARYWKGVNGSTP